MFLHEIVDIFAKKHFYTLSEENLIWQICGRKIVWDFEYNNLCLTSGSEHL